MNISIVKSKKCGSYTKISFNNNENNEAIKNIKEKGILIKQNSKRSIYKLEGNIFL